jgi:hypothetical protein
MKRAACFFAIFIAAGFSLRASAQSPDQAVHAPSGGVRTTVVSISVPPLPGAPFTAVVTTEWKRILEDGSTVTIGNRRNIARDNSGRVFQERRSLFPEGDPRRDVVERLEFSDPHTRTRTTCWPSSHICQITGFFQDAFDPPPVPAGRQPDGKSFLTRVDLGQDQVAGVEAVGTRETTTIGTGAMGNDRPVNVVKEFWYSPKLEVNLIEKRQDPRYGTQTFTMSEVSQGEPDASLFNLPDGYRTDDLRAAR